MGRGKTERGNTRSFFVFTASERYGVLEKYNVKGTITMALTDEGTNTTMLVQPSGFGGNGGLGGFGGGYEFPWLLTGQQNINSNTNNGFRDAMINDNITSVRDGINALSTQICESSGNTQMALANGFAGVNASIANASMANMQNLFGVQSGISDVKYTVASEACADRAAVSDGIRDILAATQAQTQAILTQLCNDKIESKNDTIAQLRSELLYARGQASQDVQTARILAGQNSEVDALYNRLSNCPVPSTPVYGRQPIFTCNNGCGCNGGLM